MKDAISKLIKILSIEDHSLSHDQFVRRADEFLTRNTIKSILHLDTTIQRKYDYLYRLAWFTFVELQAPYFGEVQNFIPPEEFCRLQKFFYSWDIFRTKQSIPWEEYSDIVEAGLKLYEEYLDSNLEDFKQLPGFSSLMHKVSERVNELISSGKYASEFYE